MGPPPWQKTFVDREQKSPRKQEKLELGTRPPAKHFDLHYVFYARHIVKVAGRNSGDQLLARKATPPAAASGYFRDAGGTNPLAR